MELKADDVVNMVGKIDFQQIWDDYSSGIFKLLAALTAVVAAMLISFSQGLGIEKEMLYAMTRAFIQLSVIGFFLEFIFQQKNVGWIFMAYMLMVTVAGYTAGQRAKHVPHATYVAGVSILIGTALTMGILFLLKIFPFTPRYIIPVAGMMVGNSMSVTGITLKRLRDDLKQQQDLIEAALALGATPRQATLKQVRRALVLGLAPVVDNLKTVGLISLPGAMTGLIMGGASPTEAIQLQILVLNLQLGASTFSAVLATYLTWPFFFTKAYQLEAKILIADS